MSNSNSKGKRGEREASKFLMELGVEEARRSQQYQGVVDETQSADLVHSLPGVRIEVKRGYNNEEIYTATVQEWIQTARDETPDDESWLIMWRKDRKQWVFIFECCGIVCLSSEYGQVLNQIKNESLPELLHLQGVKGS